MSMRSMPYLDKEVRNAFGQSLSTTSLTFEILMAEEILLFSLYRPLRHTT
jgi:hypothetical protein